MKTFALTIALITGILLNVIETGKPTEINVNAQAQLAEITETITE